MGGFVLDTIAMFAYEAFVRFIRYIESMRWRKVSGVVLGCSVIDTGRGCPHLAIDYRLALAQEPWDAQEQIPFLIARDAETYAKKFPADREIKIRIHPIHSTETRLFRIDQ